MEPDKEKISKLPPHIQADLKKAQWSNYLESVGEKVSQRGGDVFVERDDVAIAFNFSVGGGAAVQFSVVTKMEVDPEKRSDALERLNLISCPFFRPRITRSGVFYAECFLPANDACMENLKLAYELLPMVLPGLQKEFAAFTA
ncbi:MAG: hypothetical protein Q4D06_05175 [Coriobacteriia bacterium]|nr:hypothetical protein [Coriobacteriia bacterium]